MVVFIALCASLVLVALGILLFIYLRDKRAPAVSTPAASISPAAMPVAVDRPRMVRSPWIAFAGGVVFASVIAAAIFAYWKFARNESSPVPQAAEFTASPAKPHGGPSDLDKMADRLAARLNASGQNDGNGWALLARSYVELKRYPEAVATFERARKLIGDGDAQLLADYADAQTMANGKKFDKHALELIAAALKVDPANAKAIDLDASAAYDKGDFRRAVAQWEKVLGKIDRGSDHAQVIAANVAEARSRAGMPPGQTLAAPKAATAAPVAPAYPAAPAAPGTGTSASLSGRVVVAPALQAKIGPADTLFVFARIPNGPKAPAAIIRATARELPFTFVLDDSKSMLPGMKLSALPEVSLVARVSKSGTAVPQPGDLEGTLATVKMGASGVQIVIDREIK